MAAALSYRELPPPEDLSGWIACFWQIQGAGGTGFQHRVLPDGCADLIFDLQDARDRSGVCGEIVGPMSKGQVIELRASVDLLGIRLRPGAAGALLGIAADELLDIAVPICEAPAVLRVDSLQLVSLPDVKARVALLTAAFRARVAAVDGFDCAVRGALVHWASQGFAAAVRPASAVRPARPASPFAAAYLPPARRVVSLPAASAQVGFAKVAVLARDLGLSERAFERRFVAHVGLTPVRFRRLARLRSVLRRFSEGGGEMARVNSSTSWACLADEAGFSDQSHLVRDFREFTGLSPTQWAATQAANAGFLQDGQISAL